MDQFAKAMEIKSDEPDYLIGYARCCEHLKDFENAHTYYLKAIAMDDGKTQKGCNFYARFLRLYVGDVDTATFYLKKAMEIEPMNADSYLEYAKLLRDNLRDYDEAEKYYLKVLEINDEHYEVNGSYGYLLYLKGDYDKAMEYIEKELRLDLDDKNKWAHFYHGLLNKTMGNDEKAEEELLKADELVRHKDDMMEYLRLMNAADPLNGDYYTRFETLISFIS